MLQSSEKRPGLRRLMPKMPPASLPNLHALMQGYHRVICERRLKGRGFDAIALDEAAAYTVISVSARRLERLQPEPPLHHSQPAADRREW